MAFANDFSTYGPASPLVRFADAITALLEMARPIGKPVDGTAPYATACAAQRKELGLQHDDVARHMFRDLYDVRSGISRG